MVAPNKLIQFAHNKQVINEDEQMDHFPVRSFIRKTPRKLPLPCSKFQMNVEEI